MSAEAGLRRPRALRAGQRLGIVAPSGGGVQTSKIERGVLTLERLGFQVELAPHVRDVYGHLAGSDADRADDLLSMLERDDIDGVVCLKGGAGAQRTALAVDRARLGRLAAMPPKPFVGYSDITVIHRLLQSSLGWVTFYGPMLISLAKPSDYVLEGFRRALMSPEPFSVGPDPDDTYLRTLVPGVAEGPLLGGCLTLLALLVGTPWELDLDGALLCFEDVDEEPFAIERYLCQLLGSGALQGCRGIVIGEHTSCDGSKPGPALGLEQVFEDLLIPLGIPILYGLPIGHGKHIATLPLGVRARLDAGLGTLQFLESGVESG